MATETFRLLTLPAIGNLARKSQCSRVSRRMPLPSAPITSTVGPLRSSLVEGLVRLASGADHPQAALLELFQGAREVGHRHQRDHLGGAARDLAHGGVEGRGLVLGHDHRLHPRRIGGTQAGAEVVRIGDAIQGQQQRHALAPLEQFLEHVFAPDLAGADFRDHALVDAFRPLVEFAPIALPYRNTEPGGQFGEHLDPRIMPPLGQPQLLDPLRVMTQQRFHGMHAVDLFPLTHDLALRLRAPVAAGALSAFGLEGPLRCLVGLPGLAAAAGLPSLALPFALLPAGTTLPFFPPLSLPPTRASASSACFTSRLLRTSVLPSISAACASSRRDRRQRLHLAGLAPRHHRGVGTGQRRLQVDLGHGCALAPLRRLAGVRRLVAVALLASDRRAQHVSGRFEIDLPLVQVDPRHYHFRGVAETEAAPGAFAAEAMVHGVEMIVVAGQRGHMDQAFDEDVGQLRRTDRNR